MYVRIIRILSKKHNYIFPAWAQCDYFIGRFWVNFLPTLYKLLKCPNQKAPACCWKYYFLNPHTQLYLGRSYCKVPKKHWALSPSPQHGIECISVWMKLNVLYFQMCKIILSLLAKSVWSLSLFGECANMQNSIENPLQMRKIEHNYRQLCTIKLILRCEMNISANSKSKQIIFQRMSLGAETGPRRACFLTSWNKNMTLYSLYTKTFLISGSWTCWLWPRGKALKM